MTDRVRALIARLLPAPRLRAGATGGPRRPVKRIIVFGRHPNPTADYYFAARLAAPGMPEHRFIDIRDGDPAGIDADGTFVILCRYASAAALRWIEREERQLAGVGLFLDDDIPAVVTGRDADIGYRLFLVFRALLPLRRLNRHLDIVWASTPRLAQRLGAANARVLPPAPPEALWNIPHVAGNRDTGTVMIAYHATAVHVEEHAFLQPVIRDVLAARPDALFEVFAGGKAAGRWKGMERVTVRRPVSWAAYLAEASTRQIDIMLVPLTPSPVNDCRSPTKRIDVARAGAAGIFSVSPAYGEAGADGEILLRYDPDAWRAALLELIDDADKRAAAASATRERVAAMTRSAERGLDLSPPPFP
ncbi:hypothetical protein NOF55_16770 [Rhizobiaceae bacterium BDR2-2]|uniref:Uncharacterized protein n=1 Tax=Ectorhizobium quercum TaxID=2965071 RepID=A0AAE3MWE2_9HYPH|nr:hypothetical protein [Ectorhizobium quercum]MCX8996193.1 hypothetical protein [Ectorhizobium quercum]MCX8998768.1 hypothetical protein [Ectorhizobium quercum]